MKWWFKPVLGAIVLAELAGVIVTGVMIYRQREKFKNVLGVTTIVPVDKRNLVFSPSDQLEYFYEPTPNSVIPGHADWLSYTATYTINADSLNDRYDYAVQKPPNVFRIITLGDSFTYGQWVNTADNWSEKLEDLLNTTCQGPLKFEVINLGVWGYDVQYIAHRYEIRGAKYNPDLIIWLESGSGFDRTRELMQSYVNKYDRELTPKDLADYRTKGDYYPQWTLALQDVKKDYGADAISGMIYSWWQDFFRIRGTTPVLITSFPDPPSVAKLMKWTKGQRDVTVSTISDPRYNDRVVSDGHPNVKGHKVIAQDTLSDLEKAKLIPCNNGQ